MNIDKEIKSEIERIVLHTIDITFSLSIPFKTIKSFSIFGISSRLSFNNNMKNIYRATSFNCFEVIIDKTLLKKKKRKILLETPFVGVSIKFSNGAEEFYQFPHGFFQNIYTSTDDISLLVFKNVCVFQSIL